MIYMIIFWVCFTTSFIVGYFLKGKKSDIPVILFLMAVSSLIVAIATKDPIFSALSVPAEYEWAAAMFLAAFATWRFYLDPLKKRVMHLENDVCSLKTDMKSVKSDLSLIKNKILG